MIYIFITMLRCTKKKFKYKKRKKIYRTREMNMRKDIRMQMIRTKYPYNKLRIVMFKKKKKMKQIFKFQHFHSNFHKNNHLTICINGLSNTTPTPSFPLHSYLIQKTFHSQQIIPRFPSKEIKY